MGTNFPGYYGNKLKIESLASRDGGGKSPGDTEEMRSEKAEGAKGNCGSHSGSTDKGTCNE